MKNDIVSIEVLPDSKGGWRIDGHYQSGGEVKVFGHYRLKRNALLIGRGVAMGLGAELRVKNRKGQYTSAAASFGNDRRDRKG